jgi:hypothetical protein
LQRQKKIQEENERKKQDREMADCTFSPKTRFNGFGGIDSEKKSLIPSNDDYFFREQMKKAEESQKKIEEVLDKE